MSDASPCIVASGKSDADRAQEIKDAMVGVLETVMVELNKAANDGFVVNFSLDRGPVGRYTITQLKVSKEF